MKQQELLQNGSIGKQIKVLLDFFCEGHPPPVCLRCSPGLFRHSRGAVSCHTSSMAANPHLALTKNSSPITLANGRRVAQNREVQGQNSGRPSQRAKHPPAAAGEIPAPRTARNPLSSQSAIRRWRNSRGVCRKAAVPTPSAGGGRRPYVVPCSMTYTPHKPRGAVRPCS